MLQFVQDIALLISICILKIKHGTSDKHSLESITNVNSFPKFSQNKYCVKFFICIYMCKFCYLFLVNYFHLDDCFAQVQYT